MCWLPHCLYNCWLVVAVPVEATPCFSSLHCFTKNVHFVFFCSQSQPIWVIFVISSRSWWIMQSTGRENNLKHMSALLVDIFNNFCKVACLKFNFLVWQKPSYLRRIHFLREAMQLCSDVDCWCYFLMYVVVYAALWHNKCNNNNNKRSALHKIQWWQFSRMVDRLKQLHNISAGYIYIYIYIYIN